MLLPAPTELLYIHFQTDLHCGPTAFPQWHMEFSQAMETRQSRGVAAGAPWGGPPINPLFLTAVPPGAHGSPLVRAIVAGNMQSPEVEGAWPGFSRWWSLFWARRCRKFD